MKANVNVKVKATSDDYVKMVADEIMAQLKLDGVFWSWGVSKYTYLWWEDETRGDKPALGIYVNGFLYKGWVVIGLNVMDTYDIALLDSDEVAVVDDVYCDQMHGVIDGLIERKPEWTDEEYANIVNEWLETVEL